MLSLISFNPSDKYVYLYVLYINIKSISLITSVNSFLNSLINLWFVFIPGLSISNSNSQFPMQYGEIQTRTEGKIDYHAGTSGFPKHKFTDLIEILIEHYN